MQFKAVSSLTSQMINIPPDFPIDGKNSQSLYLTPHIVLIIDPQIDSLFTSCRMTISSFSLLISSLVLRLFVLSSKPLIFHEMIFIYDCYLPHYHLSLPPSYHN
ncbi:hypothetical protein LguiB_020806 [Lonicera macranthoides]